MRLFSAVLAEDWARACDVAGLPRPGALDDLLVETFDLLERNGAAPWNARLRRLVGGSPEPSRQDALLAALTAREREVALLAAQGLTNKKIAARLFVTVRTAEYHVHNALTKLGMASRADLRDAFGTTGEPDPAGAPEPPQDAAQPGTSAIVSESLPTA
ncbi:helix-turn-helix transcriptional regulator [Propioniciclava coleopterorum]|uniref:Helix-turn-helix transcriptional regulator n=1 Tax=Propioniciclava coleopterorum TaxID=2714937 RepID=A0A6G7YAH3_9ACTN|nr:helix-turn-helix transcriptional regulator [Propioniciclava coleopterorum]